PLENPSPGGETPAQELQPRFPRREHYPAETPKRWPPQSLPQHAMPSPPHFLADTLHDTARWGLIDPSLPPFQDGGTQSRFFWGSPTRVLRLSADNRPVRLHIESRIVQVISIQYDDGTVLPDCQAPVVACRVREDDTRRLSRFARPEPSEADRRLDDLRGGHLRTSARTVHASPLGEAVRVTREDLEQRVTGQEVISGGRFGPGPPDELHVVAGAARATLPSRRSDEEPAVGVGQIPAQQVSVLRDLALQGVDLVVRRVRLVLALQNLLRRPLERRVDDEETRLHDEWLAAVVLQLGEVIQPGLERRVAEVHVRGRLVRLCGPTIEPRVSGVAERQAVEAGVRRVEGVV